MLWTNGAEFHGLWHRGFPHGEGTFYFPNKEKLRIKFTHGCPDGAGLLVDGDGQHWNVEYDGDAQILNDYPQPRLKVETSSPPFHEETIDCMALSVGNGLVVDKAADGQRTPRHVRRSELGRGSTVHTWRLRDRFATVASGSERVVQDARRQSLRNKGSKDMPCCTRGDGGGAGRDDVRPLGQAAPHATSHVNMGRGNHTANGWWILNLALICCTDSKFRTRMTIPTRFQKPQSQS